MSDTTLERLPQSQPEASARRKGVILLLCSGLIASCGGPIFRAIGEASAWQILFYRALGMLLVVGLFVLARNGGQLRGAFGRLGLRGLAGAAFLAGAFVCYVLAMKLTTVANTLFLLAAGPLVGALLGRVFLGDKVKPVTWVAMLIAVAGISLMVSDSLSGGQFWGNLAAFGAGASFATFAVILRGASLRGRPIDANAALCSGALIGMAASAAMAWGEGTGLLLSPGDTAYALTLGILQLGLALILFTLGARYLTAAEAMLLALLEVVLGPVWTWLIFAEQPSDFGLLGGLILLSGMVLQGAWGLRPKRPPPVPAVLP